MTLARCNGCGFASKANACSDHSEDGSGVAATFGLFIASALSRRAAWTDSRGINDSYRHALERAKLNLSAP